MNYILLTLSFFIHAQLQNPCIKDGKKVLQNDLKGPCYNFTANTRDGAQIKQPLPEDLTGSFLVKSRIWKGLTYTRLDYANLSLAVAKKATFNHSFFNNATLKGFVGLHSKWHNVEAKNADFSAAKIAYCSFKNANLQNSIFVESNVSFCNFENANLIGTNFTESTVIGARFKNAKFNNTTILPFSKKEALRKGMLFTNKKD